MTRKKPIICIVCGVVACWATMTACVSIDLMAIDWDGDGVPDVTDAFPDDPAEDTDSDGDGVGDNSDDFPADPSRSRATLINVLGEADNEAAPDANDVGNANDNSSDETPPPDENPPSKLQFTVLPRTFQPGFASTSRR